MAIKIKLIDGKVPENCMKILTDFAKHRDECIDCVIAQSGKLDFLSYCSEGQALLIELSNQPEVSRHDINA